MKLYSGVFILCTPYRRTPLCLRSFGIQNGPFVHSSSRLLEHEPRVSSWTFWNIVYLEIQDTT